MSQESTTPTETETNPVGTQEVSEGERPRKKRPRPVEDVELSSDTDKEKPRTKEELDKAVKEAMNEMFSVTAWKPKEIVKFLIECPSGQNVLVKHLDILDLAAHGLVEDMDVFAKRLVPNRFDEQGRPVDDEDGGSIWKSLEDIKKQQKFLDMTNRLMAASSVRPKIVDDGVAIVKDPETNRESIKYGHQMSMQEQLEYFEKPIPPLESGEVYAGYVGFPDRMSFFVELQKPLGLVEPFREGQALVLENMEPSQGTGVSA